MANDAATSAQHVGSLNTRSRAAMSEKSPSAWRVVVVDEGRDVHAIRRLALRNRSWQRRRFELFSAMSAAEAKAIITDESTLPFEVALIDVVMETRTSGLELCHFLRT